MLSRCFSLALRTSSTTGLDGIRGILDLMFTGWIYSHLKLHAVALKAAHPLMLRAIAERGE